jgi:peptidoglycan hydrolase CwlO-like protein
LRDDKPDFGNTTAVIAYVRKRLTPTVAWSAIGALVTALVVSTTWIKTTQSDIRHLEDAVAESKKSVADIRQQLDILNKIDTQIAVMNGKVDNIADEVDRQREWRERIEGIAESPPHARKRR